jgi:hypothetical protein
MRALDHLTQPVLYLFVFSLVALGLISSYFIRNYQPRFELTDIKVPIKGTSQRTLTSTPAGILALRCDGYWYGRLGNNILSILGAAAKAHSIGMHFGLVACEHSTLNLTSFMLPNSSEILASYEPGEAMHLYKIRQQDKEAEGIWVTTLIFPSITACISRDIVRPMLAHLIQAERKYSEDA